MPEEAIDFEGTGVVDNNATMPNNTDANPANQEDATHLSGEDVNDVTGQDGNNNQGEGNNGDENSNQEPAGEQATELEEGTEVEFDGQTYTVDSNGNLVDKDNNIFKKAEDVAKWLQENEIADSDDNGPLSLAAIQEALGVEVNDENGKPVEFTDDAEGVKNYIDSVINLRTTEIQQGTINKMFNDMPMLRDFINYVQLTGSPRGFGDIPDRSGIQIDKDNPEQQKAILRMAAQEFGNKSLSESYIKYLQDSGALYDEAKAQLEALVGKDKAYRQQLEEQAQAAREQEAQEVREYWQGVSDRINARTIGGYKLPETFVKEVNGQKQTLNIQDFYDYVSSARYADERGNAMTAYQRDLQNLTNEQALDRELIDAWLMFTGGSYKDLVNMEVQKEKVRVLKQKAKQQRSTRTIKVKKPVESKVDASQVQFE